MTLSNDTELSFGRYLQSCRKMENLSLEVIANNLKVGTGVLIAIENEDLSRMPDEVFAKGFLRGFARIVHADENRVIHDYLQRLHQFRRSIQSSQNMVRENDLFWKKLVLSVAVVLFVIFLTVFMLSGPDKPVPDNQAMPAADSILSNDDSAGLMDKEAGNKIVSEAIPETIRLSINTVAETWIKIIIDSGKTRAYTLHPGDHLEFEASTGYNLLIGNATGVKLFANRIPIDIPGEKGKVVSIDIP